MFVAAQNMFVSVGVGQCGCFLQSLRIFTVVLFLYCLLDIYCSIVLLLLKDVLWRLVFNLLSHLVHSAVVSFIVSEDICWSPLLL